MLTKIKSLLQKPPSNLSMYQILGEEEGIYELVKSFYTIMESDPKAVDCLNVHELENGIIPDEVKKKLFMFLCGWLGGPNLFVEAYGHPRMRARHLHVKISSKEKGQWIYCMYKALDHHNKLIKKSDKKITKNSFMALAMRIQNQL